MSTEENSGSHRLAQGPLPPPTDAGVFINARTITMAVALLLGGGAATGGVSSMMGRHDVQIPESVLLDIKSAKEDAAAARDRLDGIVRTLSDMRAQQTVSEQIHAQTGDELKDHEQRLRVLERSRFINPH